MFFKYNTTSSSEIEGLLAKEDVTLQEVMDSETIISECRGQNKALIDFLMKPDVMEELVTLTTREPSIELSESVRFKYPNVASELLTCDVPAINERLAGDERLLEKLYEFLDCEPPLNSLLASFFSKIMGGLIAKKTEQVLDFLKARDTFLSLLIKHMGTSAIMDLTLKLMTPVEGVEMRQNILNWLDSQRIIQQLVCLLNPKIEKERHDNVAQLLCDFIRTARDTQRYSRKRSNADLLLNTLESPDTVSLLLDQMFETEKCESSIVGGISVLLVLIDSNQTSTAGFRSATNLANSIYNSNISDEVIDMEQKQKIIEVIVTRIKDFHQLLLEPPKQPSVLTTIGSLDPPVGNTRLQVIRLLTALVPSNYGQLLDQLISLGTFPVLLDLFFKYPWNNFLHTQVENCLVATYNAELAKEGSESNGELSPICRHLIDSCNLIERIIKAWKENDEQQSEKKAIRQGYMGHLISIMDYLSPLCNTTALGDHLKKTKPETAALLDDFKPTFDDVMEQQNKLLGGLHPSTLTEDDDDFNDIPFAQNSVLQQQNFSQYQMQNLPAQFIDGYSGFNDDAFNDGEDTLQTIDNPSDINFDLSESEMLQRDALFKQVCAQSINTLFDADDQVFEERDHTFQTVIEKKDQADAAENSSDSDDESPSGGDDNMDVDPWTSPRTDPWSTLASSETEDTAASSGWADFTSASFSEPLDFSAVFPAASSQKNDEQSPPPRESDLLSVDSSQKAKIVEPEKSEAEPVENVAAAGDHPHSEKTDDVEASTSQSQPSMSLEGDSCKLPIKSVEKLPDKPISEQQHKV